MTAERHPPVLLLRQAGGLDDAFGARAIGLEEGVELLRRVEHRLEPAIDQVALEEGRLLDDVDDVLSMNTISEDEGAE
jgi:hypothetical protein